MWKEYLKKYWKIAAAAVFLTVAGICYGGTGSRRPEIGIAETADGFGEAGGGLEKADLAVKADLGEKANPGERSFEAAVGTELCPETAAAPGFFVHICGEVNTPGVYELPEGSRVFEAVNAAGGFTDEAAGELLNLAEKISDGMKIVVLSKDEASTLTDGERKELSGAGGSGTPGSLSGDVRGNGLVNINTASKEALMTLSGIGESKAEEIIRYREESGGFQKIEDIMKVPGIKNAGFQKIKDSITV